MVFEVYVHWLAEVLGSAVILIGFFMGVRYIVLKLISRIVRYQENKNGI